MARDFQPQAMQMSSLNFDSLNQLNSFSSRSKHRTKRLSILKSVLRIHKTVKLFWSVDEKISTRRRQQLISEVLHLCSTTYVRYVPSYIKSRDMVKK